MRDSLSALVTENANLHDQLNDALQMNREMHANVLDLANRLAALEGQRGGLGANQPQEAILYQNFPNPFSVETSIGYFIPEGVVGAEIFIFDEQYNLVREFDVMERGSLGSVRIQANTLDPGIYFYALVINGNKKDIKRMIIQE